MTYLIISKDKSVKRISGEHIGEVSLKYIQYVQGLIAGGDLEPGKAWEEKDILAIFPCDPEIATLAFTHASN